MSSKPDFSLPADWRILAPSAAGQLSGTGLNDLRSTATDPFAPERMELLEALSGELLRHDRLRKDPAAVALGFWLRRSHLRELAADFANQPGSGCRVPAGLVLHITPANVDTMFVYSWALAFLVGNANIVRLTSRLSPLMEDLLDCLNAVFSVHANGSRGNLFVAYEHSDLLTEQLSAVCDLRIVWGGNETVRRLRAVPLNPNAAERSFASKRSLSVIDGAAYQAASGKERRHLAERMAADITPFGQQACSSPHAIYWLGPTSATVAMANGFGVELQRVIETRQGAADLGWAVRRLNVAFAAAAAGQVTAINHQPHTSHLVAATAGLAEQAEPCGAGLLIHAACSSIEELASFLRPDHQTITYFGLAPEVREHLAKLGGRAGVDRIVPVGRALDFTPYWDGFDLWNDLSRTVVVLE